LRETESPEELAGVLAHEIEHVRLRHILRGSFVHVLTLGAMSYAFPQGRTMSPELVRILLGLRFSREQELEADEGGLDRLKEASVDVSGFAHFFERLAREATIPTLLSDHPASELRAALVERHRPSSIRPIVDPDSWKAVKSICD